jgi:hypothetical protein
MQSRLFKPHFALPFRTLHPGDERVRTVGLAGFRQVRNYSCGYASALMVARHFGRTIGGQQLFERLGTGRDGTRQAAIIRELRRLDIRAGVRYDADFDDYARAIDGGKLIIGYLHDVDHWLVIYGYGRAPNRMFVADPRPGEGCEHDWTHYAPRLRGFGISCSPRPGTKTEPVVADSMLAEPTVAEPALVPSRPTGRALGPLGQLQLDLGL